MSWAQRLRRVFKIDIETCDVCDGTVRVVASIEDTLVIKKILAQLGVGDLRNEVSRCLERSELLAFQTFNPRYRTSCMGRLPPIREI